MRLSRLLAAVAAVAMVVALPVVARAATITYNFTSVQGPTNVAWGTGSFSFDDSFFGDQAISFSTPPPSGDILTAFSYSDPIVNLTLANLTSLTFSFTTVGTGGFTFVLTGPNGQTVIAGPVTNDNVAANSLELSNAGFQNDFRMRFPTLGTPTQQAVATPEPASMLLLGSGAAALFARRARQRKNARNI